MNNYSDFEEKRLNKIFNYLHWFFISSIYFFVCNILNATSMYLFELNIDNIIIFFISMILTGPALVALYSFMDKIVYCNYVDTTRDFFKGYTRNFLDSLKLWIILLTIAFILIFDLNLCFVSGKFLFLIVPIISMLVIDIILMSYSLPIISKYKIKLLDTIKLSLYLAIKNPITTVINLIIVVVSTYITIYYKGFFSFFISGIGCFLIIKNMKYSFLFIENKYLKDI